MKRLITVAILLLFTSLPVATLSFAGQAAAADDIFSSCGDGSVNGTPTVCKQLNGESSTKGSNNPILKVIKIVINVLSIIVGIAAIIGIIVSGLRLVLSNGDSNTIVAARSGLVYSLVGVAVVALAQTIVIFVIDKL